MIKYTTTIWENFAKEFIIGVPFHGAFSNR
jgi:hypothetical protein